MSTPKPIAEAGDFRIYQVAPTVWAVYKGGTFQNNVRRTDAARYGVPFTRKGAQAHCEQRETWHQEAKADRRAARVAAVAAGRAKAAARAAEAARSPVLPL